MLRRAEEVTENETFGEAPGSMKAQRSLWDAGIRVAPFPRAGELSEIERDRSFLNIPASVVICFTCASQVGLLMPYGK
jgi:hypothetical protein